MAQERNHLAGCNRAPTPLASSSTPSSMLSLQPRSPQVESHYVVSLICGLSCWKLWVQIYCYYDHYSQARKDRVGSYRHMLVLAWCSSDNLDSQFAPEEPHSPPSTFTTSSPASFFIPRAPSPTRAEASSNSALIKMMQMVTKKLHKKLSGKFKSTHERLDKIEKKYRLIYDHLRGFGGSGEGSLSDVSD